MRIAIFSDNFYPELGGVSDSIITLAKELGSHGHRVRFYVPRYSRANYRKVGIAKPKEIQLGERVGITRFWSLPFRIGTGQGRFVIPVGFRSIQIKMFDPDIIHSQLFFGTGLEALFSGKILGKPVVGTNHTVIKEFLRYSPIKAKWFLDLVPRYVNWYYGKCDLTTAPASSVIDDMRRVGFVGKTRIISNPIENEVFSPLLASERKKLAHVWKLAQPLIVYAGRLAPEKKVDILFHALARTVKKIPRLRLAIAGHGRSEGDLRRLAKNLDITEHVKFLGTISKEKLNEIYNLANLFVTASTSEVQPLTVMQAMASGIPSLAVKAGGLAELITEGVGSLVDPDDPEVFSKALEALLKNSAKLKILGREALAQSSRFSPHAVATEWEKTYREIIETHRRK